MKKITSYTIHRIAEGQKASFTYSSIDDQGNVIEQNERAEMILLDKDALDAAQKLYDFLSERIED